MKILGKYKIMFDNVVQEKNLISHDDYENIIVPKQKEAYALELKKKDREASKIKKEITDMFGEIWFTDKSPLFAAIETGNLELVWTKGEKLSCTVEKID